LIVNRANQDTLISLEQLRSVLKGEIQTWNQLNPRSKKNGIEIVFDNPSSGVIRQLKDSIAKVDKLPKNCFAVNNNEGVVDYVSKNENAIGLIGVEWISDDPVTNTFLDKIKVMSVAGDSTHLKPYQAYLAMKIYPLPRTITIINRAGRTGLATGFSSFFESERGQRIVLKAGLVPIKMPIRIVEINTEQFEITK
jgi:phosphate transport system substrate-binding protein